MKSRMVRRCPSCVCTLALALIFALAPAADAWGQTPPPAPPPAAPTGPGPTTAPATATAPAAGAPAPAETAKIAPASEPAETTVEKVFDTRVYGYIHSFLDTIPPLTAKRPLSYDRTTNQVVKEQENLDFDVDAFLMIHGTIGNRYRYFLNVAARGGGDAIESAKIELRNAWIEASLYGQLLAVRAGRMYRRFGLYNEILDATPTFIGIIEPEILDADHLMVTRTTNLMLLGAYVKDVHKVEYSITTGRDERESNQVPLGLDVNYNYQHRFKLGVSYYDSMGKAVPGVAVGEGSPKGGVADWMAVDKYRVIDAYAQLIEGPWIAQLEYCIAPHNAQRDPTSTVLLADPAASLSPIQYQRYFTDAFDDTPPTEAEVRREAKYTAQTAYVRLGYELRDGMFTPYLQGDYYKNPETVPVRSFGGDFEAGYDDKGQFLKTTLGFMYRPLPAIALKVEYGAHLLQKWGGTSYVDPELRASFSLFWEL
jgi:hypothetical protein